MELKTHKETKHRTNKTCLECDKVSNELKETVSSLEEMKENYEVARTMFLEKEKELKKAKELNIKENEKEGLDRLKLEDNVRRLILENEKLKSKDETYFNIFDCLNQFLDSKGFKILKVGEVKETKKSQNEPKDTVKTNVRFLCEECEHEASSKADLDAHITITHKIFYHCKVCTFKAESINQLMKHKAESHSKTVWKCKSCQYEAGSKEILSKHVDDVHDSIEVVIEEDAIGEESSKDTVVYQCNQCEFQSKDKKDLTDHRQKQHKPKVTLGSFKCIHCNYVGVKQEHMQQHLRMKHENKKQEKTIKYICDFCDFEATSETELAKHEKDTHMRSKTKYTCDVCKEEFATYKSRDEHMKIKHMAPMFPCDLCRFKADNDFELNRHLVNMHQFSRADKQMSGFSNEVRRRNGVCSFFNNGHCILEDKCKFLHEEIPRCLFDGRCRNTRWPYFHSQSSFPVSNHARPAFLGRRGPGQYFQQNQGQRGQGLRR